VIKPNQMICPGCGHVTLTDAAYVTCDACQRFFYAASSADCHPPAVTPTIVRLTIDGVEIYPWLRSGIGNGSLI
jgi:hypothetical protein